MLRSLSARVATCGAAALLLLVLAAATAPPHFPTAPPAWGQEPGKGGGAHRSLLGEPVPEASEADIQLVWDVQTVGTLVVTAVVSALANAAGVGGGALFVPLFSLLLPFSVKMAAALSQVAIAAGSLGSICLGISRTHPHHPHKPLVDFELALVLTPTLLLGVSSGVLINIICPPWLLTLLLVLLLSYLTRRTLATGLALRRLEQRAAVAAEMAGAAAGTAAAAVGGGIGAHSGGRAVAPAPWGGAPRQGGVGEVQLSPANTPTHAEAERAAEAARQQQQQQQQQQQHDGKQAGAGLEPAHPAAAAAKSAAAVPHIAIMSSSHFKACTVPATALSPPAEPPATGGGEQGDATAHLRVVARSRSASGGGGGRGSWGAGDARGGGGGSEEVGCGSPDGGAGLGIRSRQSSSSLLETFRSASFLLDGVYSSDQTAMLGGVYSPANPATPTTPASYHPPGSGGGHGFGSGGTPRWEQPWGYSDAPWPSEEEAAAPAPGSGGGGAAPQHAEQQAQRWQGMGRRLGLRRSSGSHQAHPLRQRFPWWQGAELLLLWGVFLGFQFGKQRYGQCSWQYGLLYAVQAALALAVSALFIWQVQRAQRAVPTTDEEQPIIMSGGGSGSDASPRHNSAPPTPPQRLLHCAGVALGGGVVAGALGIGGGMIVGPLMLELGQHPQAVSATSALIVLFSASSAAISFAVAGRLNLPYAAALAPTALVAAVVGVSVVGRVIKRSGRASLVVLLLAGVIGAGALCTLGFAGRRALADIAAGTHLGFGSFC